MRIRDLGGWPPRKFQATSIKREYAPPVRSLLFLEDVSIVPGLGPDGGCELVLLLNDRATGRACTTRVKLKNGRKAAAVGRTLTNCRGLSLSILGEVSIGG